MPWTGCKVQRPCRVSLFDESDVIAARLRTSLLYKPGRCLLWNRSNLSTDQHDFHWRKLYGNVQQYVGKWVDCEAHKWRPWSYGKSPWNLQKTCHAKFWIWITFCRYCDRLREVPSCYYDPICSPAMRLRKQACLKLYKTYRKLWGMCIPAICCKWDNTPRLRAKIHVRFLSSF